MLKTFLQLRVNNLTIERSWPCVSPAAFPQILCGTFTSSFSPQFLSSTTQQRKRAVVNSCRFFLWSFSQKDRVQDDGEEGFAFCRKNVRASLLHSCTLCFPAFRIYVSLTGSISYFKKISHQASERPLRNCFSYSKENFEEDKWRHG